MAVLTDETIEQLTDEGAAALTDDQSEAEVIQVLPLMLALRLRLGTP